MDWNHEVIASLIWLGKTFALSLLGMLGTALALSHGTDWGRKFRRISWQYFSPKEHKLPLLWLGIIIFMTLFGVRMNVLFSFWYNGFYSAMQKLDAPAFWFMLLIFSILATIHVVRALLEFYLQQAFQIRWRIWLTHKLVDRWFAHQAYHRSQYLPELLDNPDQRIQQDVDSFTEISLKLAMGLLNAVVSLIAFTVILWGLSGTLELWGAEIPRAMVFMVYIYVILATVFALKIGRPLINLSFFKERFNASFRYVLIRVREYSESIAFYRGEGVERKHLLAGFADVINNAWAIVFRSLKLQGFNLGVSQAAVVFPFIVQAPRLLTQKITLGDVMQTAEAFSQVQSALSFFRSSYDDFAAYRAVINRLAGFLDAMDAAEQLPSVQAIATEDGLALESFCVQAPSHTPLVKGLNLTLRPADSLLIRGPSGIGKTTLLRAIAGLWPYADGRVHRPLSRQSLFLPQKPYMPMGTLRWALYYPDPPKMDAHTEHEAAEVLQRCQLAHLISRLDETDDWTRILSLGEQQRLAIGRVLLNAPQVLFLDEASSAMDEGLEYAMYQLLRQTLPKLILISVGHRSSLLEFHTQTLDLQGAGRWQLGTSGK